MRAIKSNSRVQSVIDVDHHHTRLFRSTQRWNKCFRVRRCDHNRINIRRHLVKVYIVGGVAAGFAGYLSVAYFTTTSVAGHATDNLRAITAVALGGTSLFGGVATIIGTVVGVWIPAVLQNGFIIIRVQPYWQMIAVGAVLVAAVALDQWRRRSQNRG